MTILDALFDLIFPPRCLVCGAPGKEIFCSRCIGEIKYFNGPVEGSFPELDLVSCVTVYEGPIKKAIHKFKFSGKRALADVLSPLVIRHLTAHAHEFKSAEAAIAVPLSPGREKERGYNQSELLAEAASEYLKIPLNRGTLVRTKNTKPQFELKRADRLKNIEGAFKITDDEAVRNKTILLIDDILTTGTTARECAKTLKGAGTKKVLVLTLARAIED